MEFTIEFYETRAGRSPVQEFLDELKASDPDDFIKYKTPVFFYEKPPYYHRTWDSEQSHKNFYSSPHGRLGEKTRLAGEISR